MRGVTARRRPLPLLPGPAAGAAAARRRAPPGALPDRIGLAVCWALGLLFCAIAAAIVVYMLVQGIALRAPGAARHPPRAPASTEADSGGFLDPLIGTLLVAAIAIAIALPVGVGDRRCG